MKFRISLDELYPYYLINNRYRSAFDNGDYDIEIDDSEFKEIDSAFIQFFKVQKRLKSLYSEARKNEKDS